ncbi:GAF domain-containing protein [Sphaerospermopsis aphanizomenoides BCCUSP55]|uniref:GAF domain-containing protein n=1 Tax=Sphaerospermopsis aphanizomenoides TaxID=459663 RepID=UPI001905406B|nr:GAF domain-containing protein [Sphaerospermopsis aphanizomenoides]MBK1990339.1 GAF domain-containing protein [Sphaerospermopsis aphanizomenoides BCCUSP55]
MQIHSHSEFDHLPHQHREEGLRRLLTRLINKIQRDKLVRQTMSQLRESLQVDRLVLYYFYEQWHGQVTFESLSSQELSILGSTGEDDCFNENYAALYLAGRVRAIADIEIEPLETCHRDFLRSMQVRANLVVPILIPRGLWGLLAAHHCQAPRNWSSSDIELMQTAARTLATNPYIIDS